MSKHKWHKEIKAWADGAEIEESFLVETNHGEFDWCAWRSTKSPEWETVEYMYRIKPQPKEPQYLYVFKITGGNIYLAKDEPTARINGNYIGKIKLEVDDE